MKRIEQIHKKLKPFIDISDEDYTDEHEEQLTAILKEIDPNCEIDWDANIDIPILNIWLSDIDAHISFTKDGYEVTNLECIINKYNRLMEETDE